MASRSDFNTSLRITKREHLYEVTIDLDEKQPYNGTEGIKIHRKFTFEEYPLDTESLINSVIETKEDV